MLSALLSLGLSEGFILHLFRLLAFAAVGALLPAPLISVTARAALIALIGSVTLPVMAPEVDDLGSFLVALSAEGVRQSSGTILLQRVLTELAIGALLGVSLCLGFFVAALIGGWIRGLMPESGDREFWGRPEDAGRSPVELALWCIYLLALFPLLQGFISTVADALCVRAGGPLAIHEARALTRSVALDLLPSVGSVVWASAALLALPIVALTLIIDALVLCVNRLSGEYFTEHVAAAGRLAAIVLLLGWVALDLEQGIATVTREAVSADALASRREALGRLAVQPQAENERPAGAPEQQPGQAHGQDKGVSNGG